MGNGQKRQEEDDAAESHAIWEMSKTVDVVTMFAEGLSMIQSDEIRHYHSAIVNLTEWLLGRTRDKWGLAKER
jgi:hypothetical protein